MKGLYMLTLLYIVYMQTVQRKAPNLGTPQILYQHILSGTYNFFGGGGERTDSNFITWDEDILQFFFFSGYTPASDGFEPN